MQITIYRKAVGTGKAPKVNKAKANDIARRLDLVCRVRRPELEAFFISGQFYALPALRTQCIDNKPHRLMEHDGDGWTVPVGSLGRKFAKDESAQPTKSDAQSVLLWIKQNMADYVDTDAVSVVVE